MCGICGIFNNNRAVNISLFNTMVDSLSHRGPDDRGVFIHKNNAIGMRRLSIIDLEYGKQPMSNEDEKIWVVFNGEIYNYKELRSELVGFKHKFKTDHSDTEVLLHGYEEWGIDGLIHRLNGIYAFAIYDIKQDALFLVRDKLGVKPLYYAQSNKAFIFASELKSIVLTGEVNSEFSKEALMLYLKYQFVPGEQTILKDIKKLSAGHFLKYKDGQVSTWKYWDLPQPRIVHGLSFQESSLRLKDLLLDTVQRQMMSDVPIGVFLSGGLDSSIIAYLMSERVNIPLKTYSIVFPNDILHDESHFSRIVSKELKSEHQEIVFDESSLLDIIGKVIISMDEPVADPAMIPTYFMSREASQSVKVILTGEGADEVFAGYLYYRQFVYKNSYHVLKYMPFLRILRDNKYKILREKRILLEMIGKYFRSAKLSVSSRLSGFPYSLPDERILSLIKQDEFGREIKKIIEDFEIKTSSWLINPTQLQRSLYIDTKLWLAEDLLMKLDKMTMAHSLEGRVPFLDHRIVEFAFNLPDKYKVGLSLGKLVLRESTKALLPNQICRRIKHGFNVPLYQWFRGKLKDFVFDSLDRKSLDNIGLIDQDGVSKLIDYHMNEGNVSRSLWILIILSRWYKYINSIKVARY